MNIKTLLDDLSIRALHKLPSHFTARRSASLTFPEGYLSEIEDYSLSLNGEWFFHWSPDLEHLPDGFEMPDFDHTNWAKITLPATFEMKGYGTPLYRNKGWTFRVDPPKVSGVPPENYTSFKERNPTGSCWRIFRLPADWSGQRILFRTGSVQSAFRVWINGTFAGYSEDSASIAEFDITDLLTPGENCIALQVYKYCSGSYLEDQDCWRLSGVFRKIELVALDPCHIADCVLTADPENGTIRAQAELSCEEDVTLELRCNGLTTGETAAKDLSLTLPEFELWSSEKPVLYPVTLILRHAGKICDIRHFRAGFRSIGIRDRQFFVNGVSIKLKGINRHEIHHAAGRALTCEIMEQDIRLIKGANFNAVRNSHYPQTPLWYELCDLHGLYVMDEANIESHGLSYHACVLPGDDPAWEEPVLERIRAMVLQNRNHPSILIWSMGNEAGFGNAFEAARAEIRRLDPRPIQYADMNSQADFDSRTYPSCDWLEEYAAGTAEFAGERGEVTTPRQFTPRPSQKPFVANEYAHVMSCSGGNVSDWWKVVEAHECLIGGFVWEWCDHALDKDGHRAAAYGGDFGDIPNDWNFCCDGLVSADRIPHPTYDQLRALQKPFDLTLSENGDLLIRNKYYFTDLREREVRWSLVADGCIAAEGVLELILAPGETAVIPAPVPVPETAGGVYWRITVLDQGKSVGEAEACVRENPAAVVPVGGEETETLDLPGLLETPAAVFDRVWTDNDLSWHFREKVEESLKTAEHTLAFFRHDDCLRAELNYTGGEVARVGLRLLFRRDRIVKVRWLGAGSQSSYTDCRELALHGWWESKPEDLFFHFTRPMENGHRSDVQTLILTGADGRELVITADTLFGFNLYGYRSASMLACQHDFELPQEDLWELTLDLAHCGVGADNSWGAEVYKKYRLFAGNYHGNFLFRMK